MLIERTRRAFKTLSRELPVIASGIRLAVAAVLSQLIYLITMPVVTRLYSPEEFGIYGLFSAFLAIGIPVSTLGLHAGISLSSRQTEAVRLAKVIQLFALTTGLVLSLVLGAYLLFSGRQNGLSTVVFLLIFWAVLFLGAMAQVARSWAICYDSIGRANRILLGNSAGSAAARLSFGALGWTSFGLPMASLIGSAISVVGLRLVSWRSSPPLVAGVLARYREFPLHAMPQQLMNAVAKALPVLFLGWFFDDEVVGQYALALGVLALPAAVVGKSIGDALLPIYRKSRAVIGQMGQIWRFSTIVLSAVGLVPFLIIGFLGPEIFGYMFGAPWVMAGLFATVMAPWLFFALINSPSLGAMTTLREQAALSSLNAVTLPARIFALWLAALLVETPVSVVAAYSAVGVLHNLAVIVIARKKLRGV